MNSPRQAGQAASPLLRHGIVFHPPLELKAGSASRGCEGVQAARVTALLLSGGKRAARYRLACQETLLAMGLSSQIM